MAIKLTLTLTPRRRSSRIIAARARARAARYTPYPARQPSGSLPTPPPSRRVASPVTQEEPRAPSPVIKREQSSPSPPPPPPPPLNIPFTPINAAAAAAATAVAKRERKPKKEEGSSPPSPRSAQENDNVEEKGHRELTLHSIPQYFPPLGPNDPSRAGDPRYVPGNIVIDEEGVERRVLGRGEVASLSTLECWENGDLF